MASSTIKFNTPLGKRFYITNTNKTKRLYVNSAQSSFLLFISTLGPSGTNGENSISMLLIGWEDSPSAIITLAGSLSSEITVTRTENTVDVIFPSWVRVLIIPMGNVPDKWID